MKMSLKKQSALKYILRQRLDRFHKILFETDISYCDAVFIVQQEWMISAKLMGFPRHLFLWFVLPLEDCSKEDKIKRMAIRDTYLNLRVQK